ncbi:hypothetical protein E1B28_004941 [Marasmius oreades]|uniref:PARP-type domain-containing protein n=1 Tax=Marasmius oreades TaxID=181124 RepID=A0A9P7UZQ4_9AGAR|nr:uncharacterized protein E1B28_004941 [Marasmius oreades]KAG7097607.1 hypothetical protein E1B28_004941 [Marasmius oreades]
MATNPTSPAQDTLTPLSKFRLDYAASNRSKCKACSHPIDKNVLRLGISTPFRGKFTYLWRHWGCIKNEELEEIQQVGNLSAVSGYSDLLEEDQIRLSKAVEAGHVSEEDSEYQRKKNTEIGGEESGTGKAEDEKRERRKSKKRKEIDEAEAQVSESERKKKKKGQEPLAEETSVTSKGTKATPKKPETSTDVVPDSEDDSTVASPKKKSKTREEDTSKAKAKASPLQGKDKASKADEDVSMNVDIKDGNEEVPAPGNGVAKGKAKEKKAAVAADGKATKQATKPQKKTKETDSEATKTTKAKPKETAAKPTAKKPTLGVPTSSDKPTTAKPKDTNTKADKTTKPLPVTGTLNSDQSDHGPTSPSPLPQTNTPVYLDLNGIIGLLRGTSSSSSGATPETALLASGTPRSRPPPRVPLARFCKNYKLSSALQGKLEKMEIEGPHVLRLIKDSVLQSGGGLSIGELAGLRDAEERWMADCR